VALDNNVDDDNNGLQPAGASSPLFSPIIALSDGTEPTNDGDSSSSTDWSVNFGIWTGLAVGDSVWNDASGDGFYQSATETVAGITVELMNPAVMEWWAARQQPLTPWLPRPPQMLPDPGVHRQGLCPAIIMCVLARRARMALPPPSSAGRQCREP